MNHCPLFVELCAGTAALSLRLHAGRNARPPVSRMGAKTGYADVILRVLGLRPGQGHTDGTRYLWCEPDAGVRLLLHAYTDRDLAQAAAQVIRSWKDEDPRALWDRLRAEGPAVCPDGLTAREVARVSLLGQWSFRRGQPDSGFNAGLLRDREPTATGGNGCKARTCEQEAGLWDAVPSMPSVVGHDARTLAPPTLPAGTVAYMDPPYADLSPVVPPMLAAERLPPGRVGSAESGAALVACGLDGLREPVGHLRVAIAEVLRTAGVQPEVLGSVVERVVIDVVDDLVWSQWATDEALHHKAVLCDSATVVATVAVPTLKPTLAAVHATSGGQFLNLGRHLREFALACEALPGPSPKFTEARAWADGALAAGRGVPCAGQGDPANLARDLERHCKLREVVRRDTNTSIERPGGKTTGYAHDLGRDEVVALARRWADAGATVCISEAEPIPELVADGWHAVEITGERKGQRRTFSKQQREWLTLNRTPSWVPSVQASLFG